MNMEKENKKEWECPNMANVAFPWAGEIKEFCEAHARGVAMLGRAMGSPIELRKINPTKKCPSKDREIIENL